LPASPPAMRSTQPTRSGLMSCSGLNSLCGSHQRCASAENFASSAGSALPVPSMRSVVIAGSEGVIMNSGEPFLPASGACRERACIEVHEPTVRDDALAGHPHVGDVLAAGRMHELRN